MKNCPCQLILSCSSLETDINVIIIIVSLMTMCTQNLPLVSRKRKNKKAWRPSTRTPEFKTEVPSVSSLLVKVFIKYPLGLT